MTPQVASNWMDPLKLLQLCIWREARNQPFSAMVAVGCSIRNRVNKPSWWGHDYLTVILKPWQYSSFNTNDPNSTKFPAADDLKSGAMALLAAQQVMGGCDDLSNGADSYFDDSIEPPKWASSAALTAKIGAFSFYKTVA